VIKGKISNLRKIKLTDAKSILRWRTSKNVKKNFPSHVSKDFKKHYNWIKKKIVSKEDEYFVIIDKNNQQVGLCYLTNIDYKNKKAEFGYYLSSDKYYGKGHAVEVELLILKYGFFKLMLNKIYCEILEKNIRISNIHQRFGFKIDGIKREEIYKKKKFYDIILMSVLKKDFKKKYIKISNLINSIKRL